MRNSVILLILAALLVLPFAFQQETGLKTEKNAGLKLVVITPMNEAIRYEFAQAFSRWHAAKFGAPVSVDWRNIGGTTEISRYLTSEYITAFRAWWTGEGQAWPENGAAIIISSSFHPDKRPAGMSEADFQKAREIYLAFRRTDDPEKFSSRIDLYFGGGVFDARNVARQGLIVPAWLPEDLPAGLLATASGQELFPTGLSGETWRAPAYYGTTLSAFGVCWNSDRMRLLKINRPPESWHNLADPRWFGSLGLADPTKSGSIAKAFETIVQVECRKAVVAAGFGPLINEYEAKIAQANLPAGQMPDGVPMRYQQAVEEGWVNGLLLIQKIGANARYFTDSASKVPLDVGMGNAAAGLAIDFYGRSEAQIVNRGRQNKPMGYITPHGESGVSADPVSLLRGAPHRKTALRFMEFALGEEGQKLWCYRVGEPGGPKKYALQRFPIRRDFYPSADGEMQKSYENHRKHTTDDLGAPALNMYLLAHEYDYYPRWTARHFAILRDLIRAMCIDSGEELRAAWKAIIRAGGPQACPLAMRELEHLPQLPEPLNWISGLDLLNRGDRLALLQAWTIHFRAQYVQARRLAESATRGRP